MRALITGGRGFVGYWLAEHLRESGDEVVITDDEVDVTDPGAIGPVMAEAAPDAVFHLAALSHVGTSWDAPAEVLRVNVIGTAVVLGAARAAGTDPAVLVVSSAEVYGTVRPEDLPLTEAQPFAPGSPYAASKAAAEQVAAQAYYGYGQRALVTRAFNHIGPRQSPAFAVSALARRIVEARRRGSDHIAVGALTARRDFTDVRDVVRAYRALVVSGEPGTVYNVCSGHDVSVAEVAERLLAISGAGSAAGSGAGGSGGPGLRLVEDPALLRPVDLPVLRGDASRLEAATGWKPEIALDDTLRDVLAYWEAQDPA